MAEDALTPEPIQPRTAGRWLRFALGLALAALLVWWLAANTALADAEVWRALARYPLEIGAIALASAIAQSLISTAKWQMLLRRAAPDMARAVPFRALFAYTAISAAAGQIAPAYLAGPAVRAMALKRRHRGGFVESAIVAAYEQLFDVAVLLAAGVAALALLFAGVSGAVAIALFAAAIILPAIIAALLPEALRPGRLAALLPRSWRLTASLRARVEAGAAAGLDTPRLMGRLLGMSGLRYGVLAARTGLIGALVLPLVAWETIVLGFGAVQLSALATLTPGNLGIAELGWSFIAAFAQDTLAGEFVAFALVLRVSGLIAGAVLAGLAAIGLARS